MANGNFGGGDGSADNPFLIDDVADLIAIDTDDHLSMGYHYKLTADIDLETSAENPWIPICHRVWSHSTIPYPVFHGYIDGNNKKIFNCYLSTAITYYTYGPAIALIRIFGSGVIENLHLEFTAITGPPTGDISGIAGSAGTHADGIIQNCHVVCNGSGPGGISGICGGDCGGKTSTLYVDLCTVEIDSTTEYSSGMGCPGYSSSTGPYTPCVFITRCSVSGRILKGSTFASGGNVKIEDCYSTVSSRAYVNGECWGFVAGAGPWSTAIMNRCYQRSTLMSNSTKVFGWASQVPRVPLYGGGDYNYTISNCAAINTGIVAQGIDVFTDVTDGTSLYYGSDVDLTPFGGGVTNISGAVAVSPEAYHTKSWWVSELGFTFGSTWYWDSIQRLPVLIPVSRDIMILDREGIYPMNKPDTFTGVYGILPNQE